MAQDTQNVPKWFSDFAERNAKEHGELRSEIYQSETRTTLAISNAVSSATRWVIFGLATAVTIILTGVGVATGIIAALINNGG